MDIRRSYDPAEIKRVLTTPGLWECISWGADAESFDPPILDELIYLVAEVDGEAKGLFFIHPHSPVTAKVHVNMLPDCRGHEASEAGRLFLAWAHNHTDYQKLIAEIPEVFPNVRAFAERMGFEVEGVNRKSYPLNGKLVDQWHMGITRSELWDLAQQY